MRRTFLLIHNPMAGRRGDRLVRKVVRILECQNAVVTQVTETTVAGASKKVALLLRENSFDAVLVAGGDGTIRAAAEQLAGHDVPMGIIPAGTGNVLAVEIGLPFAPQDLAHLLMAGPVIDVTGAHIDGKPFFLMAGVGFDGHVIHNLNLAVKQRIGKLAYVWPILCALRAKPYPLKVTIDSTDYAPTWLILTRVSHYAGKFILAPDVDLRTGRMTAVLFNARTRLGRLRELLMLALGRLHQGKQVEQLSCDSVSVTAERPTLVEADGDALGTTPVAFNNGLAKMRLIVPQAYAAGD